MITLGTTFHPTFPWPFSGRDYYITHMSRQAMGVKLSQSEESLFKRTYIPKRILNERKKRIVLRPYLRNVLKFAYQTHVFADWKHCVKTGWVMQSTATYLHVTSQFWVCNFLLQDCEKAKASHYENPLFNNFKRNFQNHKFWHDTFLVLEF